MTQEKLTSGGATSRQALENLQQSVASGQREAVLSNATGQQELLQRGVAAQHGMRQAGAALRSDDVDTAGRHLQQAGEAMNRHRSTEELIALKDGFFESHPIDALPPIDSVEFWHPDPDAIIRRNGRLITYTTGRGGEMQRMQTIRKRLETTAGAHASAAANRRANRLELKDCYITQKDGKLHLNRYLIGQDISWLSGSQRTMADPGMDGYTGPQVPPGRLEVFTAYRTMLQELVQTLQIPQDETDYVRSNGGPDEGSYEFANRCFKDISDVEGASHAVLFGLAVLGLAFWAFKDLNNKSLSFGTILLAGAVMFLAQGTSRNNFMMSEAFAELTGPQGPLTPEKMDELYAFKRNRKGFSAMLSFVEDRAAENAPITEAEIARFEATGDHKGKQRPENIAAAEKLRMFIGQRPAAASQVLRGLRGQTKSEEQSVTKKAAKENREAGGNLRNQIIELSGNAELEQEIRSEVQEEHGIG